MTGPLDLPEYAAACLACACRNHDNSAARALMQRTGATSATGVLAALYICVEDEREEFVRLARAAISTQRDQCPRTGASEVCPA